MGSAGRFRAWRPPARDVTIDGMRCLALVLLAGCWSASEPTVDRPMVGEAPQPIEQARARRPAHSVWKGRYMCAQGPTALTLTMDHDGPTLAATFDFGPL